MKKIIIINLLTVFGLSFSVNAANIAEQLAQCAQTKDSLLRLVCYDKLASQGGGHSNETVELTAPQKQTTTKTVSAHTVKDNVKSVPSKAEEFGAKNLKKEVEEVDNIILVIKSASKNLHKQWQLTFENGQVWHQIDSGKTPMLKVGDTITIERAALGSFLLKKSGSNRSVRVRRVK